MGSPSAPAASPQAVSPRCGSVRSRARCSYAIPPVCGLRWRSLERLDQLGALIDLVRDDGLERGAMLLRIIEYARRGVERELAQHGVDRPALPEIILQVHN